VPKFSPPLEDIGRLRTELNAGEERVLRFLVGHLGAYEEGVPWEVYIQPHLNGMRPDFVLLHPYMGVVVLEVKHWNAEAQGLRLVRRANHLSLMGERGGASYRVLNPAARLSEYVSELADQYARIASWREAQGMVAGTLVVLGTPGTDVEALLGPLFNQEISRTPQLNLVTSTTLEAGSLADVVPLVTGSPRSGVVVGPPGMSPTVADRLRAFLQEPDVAAQQRDPLPLNSEQRTLATSRTPLGYRRVRGPAGSGKTTVLAARAAELSAEGKDVLFVSFNRTLWHYIHDLVVRHTSTGGFRADLSRITFTHYHGWAKWMCFDAGLEPEYRSLWSADGHFPDEELAGLVDKALVDAEPRYDALIVDEGQDYRPAWWKQLRQVVRPGGEWLLSADRAQDLYQRNSAWTEAAMIGAGFTGTWSELHGCHRLPDNLIPMLRRFVEDLHLGDVDSLPEESAQPELPIGNCVVQWVTTAAGSLREVLLSAVTRLVDTALPILPWADICVLVQEEHVGLELVEDLKVFRGLRAVHVFDNTSDNRGRSKKAFWLGDSRVKVSTIHSFKGWESRAVVLALTVPDSASAYVGFTRVKRHDLGSYLTIVTTDAVGRSLSSYLRELTA
jgi:hypothetical protein